MSEKWWDMSDDELDDLFREASEKVEIPFNSSAYNKLRQKIAEQPMSGSSNGLKKRWLFVLAGLFLMVGVGLVYHFSNDSKKDNEIKIVSNKSLSDKTIVANHSIIKNKNLGRSSVATKTTKDDNNKSLGISSVQIPTTAKNLVISSVKTPTMANESSVKIRAKIKTQNLGISSVKTQAMTNESSVKTTESIAKSSVDTETIKEYRKPTLEETKILANDTQKKTIEDRYFGTYNTDNQIITKNNSKRRIDKKDKNEIIGERISPIVENALLTQEKFISEETIEKNSFHGVDFLKNKDSKSLLTDIHTELPYYVDSLPRTTKVVKLSKFGLRFVVSPDLNSIENLGKLALGGSVGLLFEYRISKKLSIQTGMIYSNKSYVGSFDDYHNWSDWKNYHPSKPTEVDGGCKVFDVPINLRLNLFQKPKQTWFISSGISSYLMINERYTYNYSWAPSRTSNWSDNSKYYFSVLNFSVGLERQISTRFSFQIEPYLKTPLKNVGRGGVNLYSSGLLFSTKYSF